MTKNNDIAVSIVIPIYNEEGILSASVADITSKLESNPDWTHTYEIILSENGSTDGTVEIATGLMEKYPNVVRLLRTGEPNYGLAMKNGILQSRGEIVICDEIDLCDTDFYMRAIAEIDKGYDLVIGSKVLDRSRDKRPMYRRAATQTLNFMLRVFVGFKGTDTHGLKAFNRTRLLAVIDKCVVEKDLFASEFVIRAERMDFRMTEIPVTVVEKRPPSINLLSRVPNVLKNMVRLAWVIRVTNR